jgi:hypothetical protein
VVELRLKPRTFAPTLISQMIANKYHPHVPSNSEFGLWLNDHTLELVSRGTEKLSVELPKDGTGRWYHVNAVIAGDRSRLTVRSESPGFWAGESHGTLSVAVNGSQPLVFGGCREHCEPHWTSFDGSIDEVRLILNPSLPPSQ